VADEAAAKAAHCRVDLDQFHLNQVTECPDHGGLAVDQGMFLLVVIQAIGTDGRDRHQGIGQGLVELHEQAEAMHAGHAGAEYGTDPIGHEHGDEAVFR